MVPQYLPLSLTQTISQFPKWWINRFTHIACNFSKRTIRLIADFLSIQEVIRNFWSPWKQSYTLAGWVSGIMLKSLFLLYVVPGFLVISALILLTCAFIVTSPISLFILFLTILL